MYNSKTNGDSDRLTVSGQVGDAPDRIALDLNVGREHLADQRLETS